MKITSINKPGRCRTGTLNNINIEKINVILGFEPNVEDDPDKVNHSWGFKAKGKNCGIWDYKGSEKYHQFSTYGPDEIFTELFGDHYCAD